MRDCVLQDHLEAYANGPGILGFHDMFTKILGDKLREYEALLLHHRTIPKLMGVR